MNFYMKGHRPVTVNTANEQHISNLEYLPRFFADGEDGIRIVTNIGSTVICRISESDRVNKFKVKQVQS